MIKSEIKAEFIKERRSANSKLLWIVPIVFVLFSFFMSLLMGESPEGKSYIIASGFNWYPIMILPVVITLLATNIYVKEKKANVMYYRSLGRTTGSQVIAKNITVAIELALLLIISTLLIYFIATIVIGDQVDFIQLVYATIVLYIASLPLIGFTLILQRFLGTAFVIIINFVLTFGAAMIAVKSYWFVYPWAYSLRMLAPILGIHPNGTFLEIGDPLWNSNVIVIGVVISIVLFIVFIGIQVLREGKRTDV